MISIRAVINIIIGTALISLGILNMIHPIASPLAFTFLALGAGIGLLREGMH